MAITIKSQAALATIRDQVVDNWRHYKDDRAELETTWRRCMMAYLCRFDKQWVEFAKAANRSHRYLSISYDAVETWVPQVYDAMLGRDDAINLVPWRVGGDSELDDKLADDMRFLLRFQMEYGKYRRTMQKGLRSIAILGNCPWWVDWKVKRGVNYEAFSQAMDRWMAEAVEYKQEHDAIMQDWQGMVVQSTIAGSPPPPMPEFSPPPEPPRDTDIIYQGPVLRVGSIFHYVQETYPNNEEDAIRIMRSFVTKQYLKQMSKPQDDTGYRLFENVDKLHAVTGEDRAADNEADALVKMALGIQMPTGPDKIELKAQHGTFEIPSGPDAGIYENYIVVVANDHTVIRCEPSPMFSGRPLINNARLTVVEGAVYGIGILEKALDEQDTANAVHNQNVDATASVIQPEFEVVQDFLVDGIMKPSGPGVRHYVTQQGSITPINKNFQGLPFGFQAVEAAIGRHERITGAVNTAGGVKESATRTARNSNVIATKLGGAVEAVEEEFLEEALNTAMEMNMQYITDDVVAALTQDGKSVVRKIPPVDIRRGWTVRVAGSKYMAEKQERTQNLMMAVQQAMQFEANGQPSPVRKEKMAQRLFKEILGDSGDLVMDSEEYKQLLIEFQAAQAASQAAAQNGAMADGGPGAEQAGGGPAGGPPQGAR